MIDQVNDKKTFLEFVEALWKNRLESIEAERKKASSPYGSASLGWENISIEHFLESAHAWASDSKDKFPESPSWKSFAEFLIAGKCYE